MRVQIKSDEMNLNLVLPTKLLFGKGTLFLVNTVGRKFAGEQMNAIPPEALELLFAELRRIKDRHGKWNLVDIESASGEIVKVVL